MAELIELKFLAKILLADDFRLKKPDLVIRLLKDRRETAQRLTEVRGFMHPITQRLFL